MVYNSLIPQSGAGGGGVTSINTETGDITLTSPDNSITIGGTGTNITFAVASAGATAFNVTSM